MERHASFNLDGGEKNNGVAWQRGRLIFRHQRVASSLTYLGTVPVFWKVSGIVAGFVVTVLCLSRRTVLHTYHARMLPACSNFAFRI